MTVSDNTAFVNFLRCRKLQAEKKLRACTQMHVKSERRVFVLPSDKWFSASTGRNAMRVVKFLCGIVAVLMVTGIPRGATAQSNHPDAKTPIVMKLATATLNDGQHEWMKRFAAAIEAKSEGRIKAELYPASQLGAIPRMVEDTQLGSIQAFIGPPDFFTGIDPRFQLLGAPGLFTSSQHLIKTIADPTFSKEFLAIGVNKGLIGGALFISGPVGFAMRTPFHNLADLTGKKIRVQGSSFELEMIARLGATGVPISLGDVLPALQQGTIDGTLGSLGVFTALGYYDAAKYWNDTAATYVVSMVALSKQWFDKLPPDLQGLVLATSQETATEVTPWIIDFLARQHNVWVQKGGELDTLSPADQAKMSEALATVGDDIVKTRPELQPLWDLLRATAKRAGS
jgi:TRAP-type transport system periplasmic protein